MKELEIKHKPNLEVVANQKKQVEIDLIGKIIPYNGHVLWEINQKTLSIEKAESIKLI